MNWLSKNYKPNYKPSHRHWSPFMGSLAVSWNFFSLKRHFPLCQDYLPVWMLYFPQWSGFTCLPPTIWANSSYSSTQSGFCKTTRTSPNATFMLIEGMNWATLTSTSFSRSQTLNCLCSIGDIANSTKARLGSGKSIWSCLIPYWKKGVMGTSPNINWWCLTNPQTCIVGNTCINAEKATANTNLDSWNRVQI